MEQNKLAWVTGAGGLIGNYLVHTAPRFAPLWRVRGLARKDFDLLDFAAIEREFKKDKPQLIVHCAGITTIAEAQKNPGHARRVNVDATKFLAELAAESQFAFFSTDLIFDGRRGNYAETDAPNPMHVYSETKFAAERFVMTNPRHLVVRTSINGGVSPTGDRGFNEKLKRELLSGRIQKLFTDEFRCPIPAVETARAIWELAGKNCSGTFHVAGAEKLSRWQVGQLLVKRWPEVKIQIEPGLTKDFPGPLRAPDTSLDISKIQKILSHPLSGLGEWLTANPNEPF